MTPHLSQSNAPRGPRKRIGVVVDAFNAAYQAELVRGLQRACESRRIDLVVFPCGILGGTTLSAPQRNVLYDVVTDRALHGLVLLASTLATGDNWESLQRFSDQMGESPCFSIGAVLPGVPSITTDNGKGLRELVDHLVVDHGYRKLAFIGGPASNHDAQARHRAFREQLQAHDIAHESEHYFEGEFLPSCGRRAVEAFFGERQLSLDAVVAANDYMALGALEALAEHESVGLRTLPVTGFDNVARAKFSLPPLTTVEQRCASMAEEAVRCLLEQEHGNPLPARQTLAGRMVVRRSCGCNRATRPLTQRRGKQEQESFRAYFHRQNEGMRAEMARASEGAFHGTSNWDGAILSALTDEIRGVPGISFVDAVESFLESLFEQRVEVWRFHGVLRVLRAHCVQALSDDPNERANASDLIHQAGAITSEMAVRAQARASLEGEQLSRAINRLGTRVSEAEGFKPVLSALAEGLAELGLRQAHVVRTDKSASGLECQARVLFSLGSAEGLSEPFDPRLILPDGYWAEAETRSYVVLPLFFRRKSLGYAVVDFGLGDASYYETLRVNLSVALFSLSYP